MKIAIYQIEATRDMEGVLFMGLDVHKKVMGSANIDASIYTKVFEGNVKAKDLEDVYCIFNLERPDCYVGRSLSVSDVVAVIRGTDEVEPGFYFCDTIGFSKVLFEASRAGVLHGTIRASEEIIVWHKVTTRALTDEEKEEYAKRGYRDFEIPEYMFDSKMPEDGQEILVATSWGVGTDVCSVDSDEYGNLIGLEERGDWDGVMAWAAMPKYVKEGESGCEIGSSK